MNVVRKARTKSSAVASMAKKSEETDQDGLDDDDFEWGPNLASIARLGSNVAQYIHPNHGVSRHEDNLKKAAEQKKKDQMKRFREWHNEHGEKPSGEKTTKHLTEDDLPWLSERLVVAFGMLEACRHMHFCAIP